MRNTMKICSALTVTAGLLCAVPVYAFDMGNVMNPSKWMGGGNDRDRYDDNYRYPGPGYGYGGPGYPPPGYGAPGYGYGDPGYGAAPGYAPGYGVAPGQGQAPAYGGAPGYPAGSSSQDTAEEVERLRERVRVLEEAARQQQQQQPAPNPAWGNYSTPGYNSNSYAPPASSQTGQQGYSSPYR